MATNTDIYMDLDTDMDTNTDKLGKDMVLYYSMTMSCPFPCSFSCSCVHFEILNSKDNFQDIDIDCVHVRFRLRIRVQLWTFNGQLSEPGHRHRQEYEHGL
jgi:hypothetical protein